MKRDVLFTHILFVKAVHTSKLLQSEMCRLSINKMIQSIVKNMPMVALALSLVYIYTAVKIT